MEPERALIGAHLLWSLDGLAYLPSRSLYFCLWMVLLRSLYCSKACTVPNTADNNQYRACENPTAELNWALDSRLRKRPERFQSCSPLTIMSCALVTDFDLSERYESVLFIPYSVPY